MSVGEFAGSFHWHPSRAHLVQCTVIDMPGAPDSTSTVGCDAANGAYIQLDRDELGGVRYLHHAH